MKHKPNFNIFLDFAKPAEEINEECERNKE